MKRTNTVYGALALLLLSETALAQTLPDRKIAFDLAPQPLARALSALAEQSNLRIVLNTEDARGFVSERVTGTFSPRVALQLLLASSTLEYEFVDDRTVEIRAVRSPEGTESSDRKPPFDRTSWAHAGPAAIRLAQAESGSVESDVRRAGDGSTEITPDQVVVTGSRLPGVSEASAAPIQVFDRKRIDSLGVTQVADVLNYLPQQLFSQNEQSSFGGSRVVRLRGLGVGTTLVLINGRRTVTSALQGSGNVFDLNSVPLSAVERIEILSDSASAIYGTDAVGGVVNIIMRDEIDRPTLDIYYGAASGGADEKRASLTIGKELSRLRASIVVDYFERELLLGSERDRTSDQDYRRFGGTDWRTASSNPGNVTSRTTANLPGLPSRFAAVPAGSTGVGLTPASFAATANQRNQGSVGGLSSIVPMSERTGVAAFAEYDLTDAVGVYSEVLYGHREEARRSTPFSLSNALVPATNAFNPFGVPVSVSFLFEGTPPQSNVSKVDSLRGVLGFRGSHGRWDWDVYALAIDDSGENYNLNAMDSTKVNAALASNDPARALNVFVDGPPGSSDLLGSLVAAPVVNNYASDAIQGAGFVRTNLLSMPHGALQAVLGVEWREEKVHFESRPSIILSAERRSSSAYSELRLPILSEAAGVPFLQELSFSLAGRYDRYDDFGGTFNPQYLVDWRLSPYISVRGSYGTSFRAPSLFELHQPLTSSPSTINDPRRNNEQVPIALVRGGNAFLEPEESDTWTVGFALTLPEVANFRMAASYWQIEQEQRVQRLQPNLILANEALFPTRISRNPPSPADMALGRPGTLSSLDSTSINFGRLETSGVDVNLSTRFETRLGRLSSQLAGTRVAQFRTATFADSPVQERVGIANLTDGTIPRWRATATLGWEHRGMAVNVAARHVPSYADFNPSTGLLTGGTVESQTLADLQASVSLDNLKMFESWWSEGVTVRAGVRNLFDEEPPFAEVGVASGYDPTQGDIRGRFGYLTLTKTF